MRDSIELQIDVTEVAGLDEAVHTAVSVFVPDSDRLRSPQVVVFGFPGAGYSRGYFSFDMPGASWGGQAGYHVNKQGWVFVACDHLGVGDSSLPDVDKLTMANVTAANGATVDQVVNLLRSGSLARDIPPLENVIRIGMGQSMGGCFTIYLQGRAPRFDGVAILGFSAIHGAVPKPDGSVLTFGSDPATHFEPGRQDETLRWAFHYCDVPRDVVDADVTDYPTRRGHLPPWGSATIPGCVRRIPEPGIVAPEAAAIEVPVFVGTGEIDIVPDPRAEPSAYSSATDITVYVQPEMAHMHNFAGNRTELWDRLGAWANGVGARG
jgi:pimeloyl-ACP methyl ester carboxylesterase